MTDLQSTEDLQGRINLAMSIFDQRECSEHNWKLAFAALKGTGIVELQAIDGDV